MARNVNSNWRIIHYQKQRSGQELIMVPHEKPRHDLCWLSRHFDEEHMFSLFKFSRVNFLDVRHDNPLPDVFEYISALETLSNRGTATAQ